MESIKIPKSSLLLHLLIILFSSHIILGEAVTPAGSIERTIKQQVLASLPPSDEPTPTGSSQHFLTSPSGKYTVFLLRRETSVGAGGFGTDFCYVQVQAAGVSVWESECTVISNVNTCSLVFSDAGLEIFDGSQSAWDTDVDLDEHQHLETLELVDSGDIRIRDKEGELKWKASDNPIVNQNCGSIGAPGLIPDHPAFGQPIHGGRGPFGQPSQNQGQQTQLGVGAPLGQPLQNQAQQSGLGVGAPLGQPLQNQGQEGGLGVDALLGQPLQNQGHETEVGVDAPFGQPLQNQGQQTGLGVDAPFGQPLQNQGQETQPSLGDETGFASSNQAFGRSGQGQQPLVDNTPFDSGSLKEEHFMVEFAMVCLMGCFGYFLL